MWRTLTRWRNPSTRGLSPSKPHPPDTRETIQDSWSSHRLPRLFPFSLWMHTMNRCLSPRQNVRRSATAVLALSTLILWPAAQAQTLHRMFPDRALRGTLVVLQPPLITMDGVQTRLTPGSRIRGTNNTLVLSGSAVGQELTVNYVLSPDGQVHDVWILTDIEAAEKRPRAADLSN